MAKIKISSFSLEEKKILIDEYDKLQMSKAAFARSKGIPQTTFLTILSAREKIKSSLSEQDGNKRKKLRKSNFQDIEDALLKWFRFARTNNVPISGLILKEKALEIAKEFEEENFSASNGWIERFKDRYNLSFKKVCGEAAAVNSTEVDSWKNSSLKNMLQRYAPCDIFNLDETGLFFRMLPEKTLCFQSDPCSGGKKSKERVTVLLGANMTGTEKLRPLIIGKSSKPRCFKNVKVLPVTYKANSKSWMTSGIWEETIKSFDAKFHSVNRKVVFVIDNCAAHTDVKGLKAIELMFLPPNATSVLQPLDQGVILSFKTNYRKRLVRNSIAEIDQGRNFRPTLFDALKLIHKSWNDVTERTIVNCYKKAGFFYNDAEPIEDLSYELDEDDIPLAVLFGEIQNRESCTLEDLQAYLKVDETVSTSAEATISDIVAEVRVFYLRKVKGFKASGVWPLNVDIFQDSDFAPFFVTDRPDPNEQSENSLNMIEKLSLNLETANETTPSCSGLSKFSSSKIRPLPKAPPRKTNINTRRKRKSTVLIDTPEKEALRMEYEEKMNRKQKKDDKDK
ncbi:tigger transposable element-derived protein 4-like [Uloborus diversus]|uniref:tigger transposable element-derived protein 4-like n=1 Tax=Uloborus diversus TaxID=327109 RepID=UPI00240A2214|nr:tigger transposable element-derived protein 4-like [Uloborus diversus]